MTDDYYQLPPPTNTQKGAFDVLGGKPSLSQQKTGVAATGAQLFLDLSETCMALRTIKRQKNDQKKLIDILRRMRVGESTPADASELMNYHLANFSNTEVNAITKTGTTMHLFAFKKSKNEFNYLPQAAKEVSSANNPVGMSVITMTSQKPLHHVPKHQPFANPTVPPTPTPKLPPMSMQQVVPIPMVTMMCKNKCCKATFCPLALSFSKTLHTFQGQSAGPVNQGQQQPNAVDRVFVDPGDKKFESGNPGLLYMAVSRATTLGENTSSSTTTGAPSPPSKSQLSAIYFTGHNMTLHRVTNLKLKKNGDEYEKVQLRNKWVARVEANTVGMQLAPGDTPEAVSVGLV